MHWCADETLALLSVIPFVGFFIKLYRAKVSSWFQRLRK